MADYEYRPKNPSQVWSLYMDDNGQIRDSWDDRIYRGKVQRRAVGNWEDVE